MTLYLTIFDETREVTGWVFGHYSDFGYFRDRVAALSEAGSYPTLLSHSDCDGSWDVSELEQLKAELRVIGDVLRRLPPEQIDGAFEHAAEYRAAAHSLYDCFHNVDGENVIEALIALCDEGLRYQRPILFQ